MYSIQDYTAVDQVIATQGATLILKITSVLFQPLTYCKDLTMLASILFLNAASPIAR